MSNPTPMSPVLLSRYLGQQYPPTDQQADVIGAEPGPLLVVAGAGAGKTVATRRDGVRDERWREPRSPLLQPTRMRGSTTA